MDKNSLVHNINELEVIGYADVIKETTVPRRVPPIFRFYNIPECLFPPFNLVKDLIIKGNVGPESDFEEMVQTEMATKLEKSFRAISQGMLWVDENLKVYYGSQEKENKKLYEQAAQKFNLGFNALKSGNLEEAIKCARWASAANQKSLKALALEAAIYRIQGEETGVKMIKKLAEDVPDYFAFDSEVSSLVKLYPTKDRNNRTKIQ